MMLEPLGRQYAARVEIASSAPVIRASIPEGALRQILFALAANAIEASPGMAWSGSVWRWTARNWS